MFTNVYKTWSIVLYLYVFNHYYRHVSFLVATQAFQMHVRDVMSAWQNLSSIEVEVEVVLQHVYHYGNDC